MKLKLKKNIGINLHPFISMGGDDFSANDAETSTIRKQSG